MVKVTALSKRAVVRIAHACPASASHSTMVRRLCVTPAVGSLMQWLLTRRNRTTELSTDHEHVNTTQSSSPVRSDNVSGNWSEGATGKDAAAVAGTVEAREGGGACRGA